MNALLLRAGATVTAFAVDQLLGEPPARVHPVAWMGRTLAAVGGPWSRRSPALQFALGASFWWAGALLLVLFSGWVMTEVGEVGSRFGSSGVALEIFATGLLLKPLFAWRMLREEVAAVEVALARSTNEGRQQLRRLVSRDTRALTEREVREGALESLAENLNDSLIAPLFWFLVAGLPGAVVYRYANTADAMWGYRDSWEWAGKWAARADDLLSYVPARITALLLALVGWRLPRGLTNIARVTPSLNGGWPMGMLALVLNVRLTKPGIYVLHPSGAAVVRAHISAGIKLCERVAWLGVTSGVGIAACAGLLL
jgi:adenosylcobinamide-phosphate synthase